MKKLLLQLDTDPAPSIFDAVVAHDGGADHLMPLAGVTPDNCAAAIEGIIYTRGPADKKNSAVFIGGSDLAAGEALLAAVRAHFYAKFRVSVMLDSNGANTTAAAAVALVQAASETSFKGRIVTVLAGTGPVGQRIAGLLGRDGATVRLTSRTLKRAQAAAEQVVTRFDIACEPVEVAGEDALGVALDGTEIAVATGAAGVQLLPEAVWRDHPTLTTLVDPGTTPPSGIEGLAPFDRNEERHGKHAFGGLAIGAFKLRLHRACIARLFERNDEVLDIEAIHDFACSLLTADASD